MYSAQANEVNYDLQSLGWKAFQNLCSTIVSEVLGQTTQVFFDSQDGGRDGAFNGNWHCPNGEEYTGSFTVQCKHTTKYNTLIKLSDLKDELEKAKRLAANGLADNYFLFCNAKLTGVNDETIRKEFEKIPEVKRCTIFGGEKISRIIHETKKLRMLVPRVYGLGDLSQILDERAYDQAKEILSSLGDDLNKFIVTEAYRQSEKALAEHGFVLLLGEPMCGKSTIAAALSMGALDNWECSTIKVRDADDFVKHFNPDERQLFWVDDAFGPTQVDWVSATNWSKTFPHVKAALNRGSKVIFTSRNYVYKSARQYLKESALPIIMESQVVIHVESMTKEEREQILYNHIRLGDQTSIYKKKIKPFLSEVASNQKFSPEIARRLGNSFFTKSLSISSYGLNNFIENPLDMLCEIINTMDDGNRSALALIFMRGGSLPSPVEVTTEENNAISRIGGNIGCTIKGLESLDGSLVINSVKDSSYYWSFKHPTIRDAFAKIVASNPEFMDIYITGTPLDKLFSEVSCGDVGVRGVSVIVPTTQYNKVIDKIKQFDTSKWFNKSSLFRFLSYRCDKRFLSDFLSEFPDFISNLKVNSYIYACSDVSVLSRLHAFELLPEIVRRETVLSIKGLAVRVPDAGFLRDDVSGLILPSELSEILHEVKTNLLPDLESVVSDWKSDYDGEDEPDSYFDELRSAINAYRSEFETCAESIELIDYALNEIDDAINDLGGEYCASNVSSMWAREGTSSSLDMGARSVFDDVDS